MKTRHIASAVHGLSPNEQRSKLPLSGRWKGAVRIAFLSMVFHSSVGAATQSFDLREGWNLLTFRLQPTQPSPADVFAAIETSIDSVWGFEAAGQRWRSYLPGGADPPAGLSAISADQAYWVHATRPIVNWELEGELPGEGGLQLAAGWNLVGMPVNALDLPAILRIGDLFRGQNVLGNVRLFKWRRSALGVSDEATPSTLPSSRIRSGLNCRRRARSTSMTGIGYTPPAPSPGHRASLRSSRFRITSQARR